MKTFLRLRSFCAQKRAILIEKFLRTETGHSQPDSKCPNSYSDARKSLLMTSGIKILISDLSVLVVSPNLPGHARWSSHFHNFHISSTRAVLVRQPKLPVDINSSTNVPCLPTVPPCQGVEHQSAHIYEIFLTYVSCQSFGFSHWDTSDLQL
jgi:hypothetical protein